MIWRKERHRMSTAQTEAEIPSRLNVSDEFGYWFSGFFDGEGSFTFKHVHQGIVNPGPKIQLTVRQDDRGVIEYIHSQLCCGRIHFNEYKSEAYKTHQPWVAFRVNRIDDLAEVIVPLFERYPLHSKKAMEFTLFGSLVRSRYRFRGQPISDEEREVYGKFYALIEKIRKGDEPSTRN
jgi:hypothetical protein